MKDFIYVLSIYSNFRLLQLAIITYFLLLIPLYYLFSMALFCSFGGPHPLTAVLPQGCVAYVGVAVIAIIWSAAALHKRHVAQFYVALAAPIVWAASLVVLAVPLWVPELLWNHSCYPWSWWLAIFGM